MYKNPAIFLLQTIHSKTVRVLYRPLGLKKALTLFHAALGLLAQAHCALTLHKEG
jgi:hypothetical protein